MAQIPPAMMEFILNGPALKTPPGVTRHLDNISEDLGWGYTTIILSFTIAGIFFLLRLYTKFWIIRRLEAADYFLFVGFLLFIAEVVMGRLCIPHGAGAHQWNIQIKHLFKLLYLMNIAQILYGPWVFVVKMALLLQYLHIFAPNRTVNRSVFLGSWIIAIACAVFYVTDTFVTIFACTPREKIWNKLYMGGHCMNYYAIIVSSGLFNIVSDVAILLLPTRTVWKLQIPIRKKIMLSLVFGTGLLACVASTMRVFHTWRIVKDEKNADISYNMIAMGLWSYAEVSLGMIIACALSLPTLMQARGWNMSSIIARPFKRLRSLKTNSLRPTESGDTSSERLPEAHKAEISHSEWWDSRKEQQEMDE